MLTTTLVSRLMTKDVITVSPDDTMDKIRDIFQNNAFHHIPVVENEILVGMISTKETLSLTRDIDNPYVQKRNNDILKSTLVGEVMQKDLITVSPGESIYNAFEKFNKGYFHSLPVVTEGKLLGIFTMTDLTRFLFEELRGERFLF